MLDYYHTAHRVSFKHPPCGAGSMHLLCSTLLCRKAALHPNYIRQAIIGTKANLTISPCIKSSQSHRCKHVKQDAQRSSWGSISMLNSFPWQPPGLWWNAMHGLVEPSSLSARPLFRWLAADLMGLAAVEKKQWGLVAYALVRTKSSEHHRTSWAWYSHRALESAIKTVIQLVPVQFIGSYFLRSAPGLLYYYDCLAHPPSTKKWALFTFWQHCASIYFLFSHVSAHSVLVVKLWSHSR